MSRALVMTLLAGALTLLACGSRQPPYGDQPVDFVYRSGGVDHRFAELRGRPVVLVLIRTSELTSEIYLREVKRAFGRIAGKIRFLVLSLEPTEEPFLEQFAEFHELPFTLGAAELPVALGQTALGTIPLVPSTYLVDRDGRVRDLAAGAVSAEEIGAAVRREGWL